MAKAISNVPLLTGEVAERFVNEAEYNAKHLAGSKYDAEAHKDNEYYRAFASFPTKNEEK